MKNLALFTAAMAVFFGLLASCQKEQSPASLPTPKVVQGEFDYLDMDLPSNFGFGIDSSFFPNFASAQNPLTNEGATLGRVLFYDGHLSKNNLISCGSCHVQSKGFADPAQVGRFDAAALDRQRTARVEVASPRR